MLRSKRAIGKAISSSSKSGGNGGNGGSSPPLRPSKRTKGVITSSSSSPFIFWFLAAANYIVCYCADGTPNDRKSFTWPFDRKLKNGDLNFGQSLTKFFDENFIGSFPRRATDDNDPMLYTFIPKQYNINGSGFYGFKKKEQEKKAVPWHVSFIFIF